MKLRLRCPRYADITATLALLIAMGGTAYAANTVGTSDIIDQAVTTPKIADEAVTSAKIAPAAVTGAGLGSGAVTSTKLAAGAVTSPKIAHGAVTSAELGTGAVDNDALGNGSVSHNKIVANAVTGDDIASHTVHLADLAGADATGKINFTLTAHSCGYLDFGVPGARVGETAILSWLGTRNPPNGIYFGPLKVTKKNVVVASACNMNAKKVTGKNLSVRVTVLN